MPGELSLMTIYTLYLLKKVVMYSGAFMLQVLFNIKFKYFDCSSYILGHSSIE